MSRPLNVGIVCYASVGGSGIVATELGKALASRGHQVHIISTETPFRLGEFQEGLFFHQVQTPTYPLFREPQYLLSLANTIVQVARESSLDIVHAHYAVPHATAAFLARQVLASTGVAAVPRVVTTLHGTDITLIGSDPSYSEIVAFSIEQSNCVTAVSDSLRTATYAELGVKQNIAVIPNFLDTTFHRRHPRPELRRRFTGGDARTSLVIHVSNFRPVKRADSVMGIFDRIRRQVPARLVLVGDGPDLAALEAMACEVPVVASQVGGLPEVIEHGVTGFLHPVDALDDMAASAVRLLTDAELHARVADAACRRVRDQFSVDRIVPLYEECYRRLVAEG